MGLLTVDSLLLLSDSGGKQNAFSAAVLYLLCANGRLGVGIWLHTRGSVSPSAAAGAEGDRAYRGLGDGRCEGLELVFRKMPLGSMLLWPNC